MVKIYTAMKNIAESYAKMDMKGWRPQKVANLDEPEYWANVCGAGRAIIFKVRKGRKEAEVIIFSDTPKGEVRNTLTVDGVHVLTQKGGDGCAVKLINSKKKQSEIVLIYDKKFADEDGNFDYEKGMKSTMKKIESAMKDMN
jgi:hypothetical protein